MNEQMIILGGQRLAQDADTGRLLVSLPSGSVVVASTTEAGASAAVNGGSAVNVSSVSKAVAAANAARKTLLITNRSLTGMLTLNLGGPAVSGAGIVLAPASDATHPGGSVTLDGRDYAGAVNGILSVADATFGNVAVVEV